MKRGREEEESWRDKRKGRRKRKKSVKEPETCLAGEKGTGGGAWKWDSLAMVKVLSLVLTDKGPTNSPEFPSWTGLQTLANFLPRRLDDFGVKIKICSLIW